MNEDTQPHRRILFGRRRGKALRKTQKYLVDVLLPKIRVPTDKIVLSEIFPDPSINQYWLEIGFGAGEHLAWQAALHKNVGIIGCEPFINGVAGLLVKINGQKLENVRIHDDVAEKLLDILPTASLERVFLLFADPWPKTSHHKRRFVQPDNIASLSRVLEDGAELRIGTDHADYGGWILWHMLRSPDFIWQAESAEDWSQRKNDWPVTRYEKKAAKEGRKSVYYRFIRRNRP
jgi:tRNA (guanine-N7-)-methyltransferase